MHRYLIGLVVLGMLFLSCRNEPGDPVFDLQRQHETLESIRGKPEYLSSPMLTAGNRVYLVGHQDGSFPELGWHIPGEMGGIWDHPIKLMDGFSCSTDCKMPARQRKLSTSSSTATST